MNFSGRESSQAVPHTGRADARHGTAWPAQMGLALTFAQHLKGDGIETHLPCWKGLSFFPTPAGVMQSPHMKKGFNTARTSPTSPTTLFHTGKRAPTPFKGMDAATAIHPPYRRRGFSDGFRRDGLLPRGLPASRKSLKRIGEAWRGKGKLSLESFPFPLQLS